MGKSLSITAFFNVIVISLLLFSALVNLTDLNMVALYIAIPTAFIISLIKFQRFLFNKYLNLLLILYLWIAFTVLFAHNISIAWIQMHSILGAFILSYVVAIMCQNEKSILWLYGVYISLFIGTMYYAYNNVLNIIDFGEERFSDEKLNSNTLAYYLFYTTVSIFMISEFSKNKIGGSLFKILFIGIVPFSLYIAILTASRQVLLVQIPLLILLFWYRYVWKNRYRNRWIFILCVVVLLIVFWNPIKDLYQSSLLYERSQVDVQDDGRFFIAMEALKVGINHFFVGVGPGNFYIMNESRQFAHNTFLELFANTGFIGMYIYSYMLILFLYRQLKRFRIYKDKVYILFFIIGIIFFLDQFFYVFYYSGWLISFFILVATHSERYYSLHNKYLK